MLFWDTRRLGEPTDVLELNTQADGEGGQILGGSSMAYNTEVRNAPPCSGKSPPALPRTSSQGEGSLRRSGGNHRQCQRGGCCPQAWHAIRGRWQSSPCPSVACRATLGGAGPRGSSLHVAIRGGTLACPDAPFLPLAGRADQVPGGHRAGSGAVHQPPQQEDEQRGHRVRQGRGQAPRAHLQHPAQPHAPKVLHDCRRLDGAHLGTRAGAPPSRRLPRRPLTLCARWRISRPRS